jgi:hypothetical protein
MGERKNFCNWCNAPIIWLRNVNTQKHAPVDELPVENGNISIDAEEGTYDVVGYRAGTTERYTNHWFTCPNAKDKRK